MSRQARYTRLADFIGNLAGPLLKLDAMDSTFCKAKIFQLGQLHRIAECKYWRHH